MVTVRTLLCLADLFSSPVLCAAQPAPPVAYDVSSVKPHDPADQNMSWSSGEDGFRAMNVDLKNVIAGAWGLRPDQVSGEPPWADDLHWDIAGKSTELTPVEMKKLTADQRSQMMQQLLAERFHLKAHLETRTGPVFPLLPAKGGIKLVPIPMTLEQVAAKRVPGSGLSVRGGATTTMEAKKISLSMLTANLAGNLHQTVIDKTGLPTDAVYDFTLRFAPDFGTGTSPDSDALPLPQALQDQLGIHVEASRGPVQVLIVDHVEKPAAN
jgi:uncharacterized protein (TIGR03435 family)